MGTGIIKDESPIKKKESEDRINQVESKSIEETPTDKISKQKPIIKKSRKINVRGMITGAYSRKR